MNTNSTPLFIKILGWLISLSAFALGFWHTHHGLMPMKPLGTVYGSFVVAGLISMVLIVAYSRAMSGVKIALLFYLICAGFNFTFNVNSFYPTLLSRKLLKEETLALNDTLQNYAARMQKEQAELGNLDLTTYNDLNDEMASVLREIKNRGGFGPEATSHLAKFNQLAGSNISADRNLGVNQSERNEKVNFYTNELKGAIDKYVINDLTQGNKTGIAIIENNQKLDSIRILYTDSLKEILKDNSDIKVDSLTKFSPQIRTLQNLVSDIDNIAIAVNKATNRVILKPLNDENRNQNSIPKIQYIGQFDNTVESVIHRRNRLDTWGVLLLVFFIDFVVPLAIYFLIRGKTDQSSSKLVDKLSGKKSPSKF